MQRCATTTRFMVQLQAAGYFTATPNPPSNVTSHRNSTSEDSVARWMSEHLCNKSIAPSAYPLSHEHERHNPEFIPAVCRRRKLAMCGKQETSPSGLQKGNETKNQLSDELKTSKATRMHAQKSRLNIYPVVYLRPRFYHPPFLHWRRKGYTTANPEF